MLKIIMLKNNSAEEFLAKESMKAKKHVMDKKSKKDYDTFRRILNTLLHTYQNTFLL